MTKDEALFAYLESRGFNPYRMGNWNKLEGIGLAESSFLAGWDAAIASTEPKDLDPKPWLFISDQVVGEHRSDRDKGHHDVSGTWWAFSPRPEYEQDRARYEPIDPSPGEGDEHGSDQEPVDDDRR